MIVSGDPIGADEARNHGLIDAIVTRPHGGGVAFAEKKSSATAPPLKKIRDLEDALAAARGRPRSSRIFVNPSHGRRALPGTRELHQSRRGGVNHAVRRAGSSASASSFSRLMASPESKAQRYFFFARAEAAKDPGRPADTAGEGDQDAAVVGAGTMGGGIAMTFG